MPWFQCTGLDAVIFWSEVFSVEDETTNPVRLICSLVQQLSLWLP